MHRFCDEKFYDTYISTIGKNLLLNHEIFKKILSYFSFQKGIDFKQKLISLDGVPVKLQIWDTAGQERFRTLTTAYYRGAMGILLMYDVTNLESYNNLSYWLRNIQEVIGFFSVSSTYLVKKISLLCRMLPRMWSKC